MSCRKHRRLALLAGGDLGSREARRLRKHLEGCEACRSLLVELEGDRARLQSLATMNAEEGGARAVGRRALEAWRRERAVAKPSALELVTLWISRRARRAVFAAVAVALLILVGSWIVVTSRPSAVRSLDHERAAWATVHAFPRWAAAGEGDAHAPLKGTGVSTARVEVPPVRLETSVEALARPPRASAPAEYEPHLTKFTVKLETGDPRVVIYWVVETRKGAAKS